MTHAPSIATDEALVSAFARGDEAAFAELLRRHQTPVYNFVLRMARDRDAASELTQEAFLRVVQKAGTFDGRSKFTTWLYTIARNLCVDHARRMRHRRHASLDAPTRAGDERGATMLDRVASGEAVTDRRAIAGQLRDAIHEAVEALPDDQREVFLLRQVQRMPFAEIGEVLGIPTNTAKSRMRYALERLQGALEEYRDYVPNARSSHGR